MYRICYYYYYYYCGADKTFKTNKNYNREFDMERVEELTRFRALETSENEFVPGHSTHNTSIANIPSYSLWFTRRVSLSKTAENTVNKRSINIYYFFFFYTRTGGNNMTFIEFRTIVRDAKWTNTAGLLLVVKYPTKSFGFMYVVNAIMRSPIWREKELIFFVRIPLNNFQAPNPWGKKKY